jgi:hypothetical protein
MSAETLPTVEQCLEEIRTKPTVPPWPTVGVAVGLSKGGTYDAMRRGDFETLRVGRLIKVKRWSMLILLLGWKWSVT